MGYKYAVVGAGMQGTAAAYDLAVHGDADEVRLLDVVIRRAQDAAARVNDLVGREVVKAGIADATDKTGASQVLEGMHACLSGVPYFLNVTLAKAAIAAGVHFADLGGNTEVVRQELALDKEAKDAGVSILPDCGVAPGMVNILAVYGMNALDKPELVKARCGGLPQSRNLPLGYKQTFAMEGLTNEYTGKAITLRDSEVTEIETFEDLETFELPPPIGEVEAFLTAGGCSSAPTLFAGQLKSYDYKTIRYPGHCEKLKLFRDMGFLSTTPIEVKGASIVPRDVFHTIMGKVWDHPEERDLIVALVDVEGDKDGRRMRHRSLVIDRHDEKTGFSAMERTTAFSAAIVTFLQAQGKTPVGALPLEKGVDPALFVAALAPRGIELQTSLTPIT